MFKVPIESESIESSRILEKPIGVCSCACMGLCPDEEEDRAVEVERALAPA